MERAKILQSDMNVAFVLAVEMPSTKSFLSLSVTDCGEWSQEMNGDLFQGFNVLVHVFEHEMHQIIDTVHFENRTLIGIYLVLVQLRTLQSPSPCLRADRTAIFAFCKRRTDENACKVGLMRDACKSRSDERCVQKED